MKSRHYETVFILSPTLSDEQVKQEINKYRSFLSDRDAIIENEDAVGLKPLAYAIKQKKRGYYHFIHFVGSPHLIKELERNYARDEQILRFLTFALDKHALACRRNAPLDHSTESSNNQGKEHKQTVA